MDGLQLIQHVVDLSVVELIMKTVERPDVHDVIVVGVIAVKDDSVLCVYVNVCVSGIYGGQVSVCVRAEGGGFGSHRCLIKCACRSGFSFSK